MDGEQQPKDGQEEKGRRAVEVAGLPDLARTLQVMSIAEPRLSSVQVNQLQQAEELDFSFCLLMKVACTGGTPRNITKNALKQSMARAWRNNYYAISQVSDSVFLAHFRSHEAMMSVYMRQPWTVGSDNLLLDWFDLEDEANSSGQYRFEYVFVTVRAYGVPSAARSLSLLADILNKVGVVSEYHILQQNMLFARQDYIWGMAKMRVNDPVKDKILVNYPDGNSGLAYLHYEKIKRICLFCGVMFHNAQHCPLRTNILKERSKKSMSTHDIPMQRYGQWVIEEDLVPLEAIRTAAISNLGHHQAPNPILARLQKLFANDPNEKGKQTEQFPQSSLTLPLPRHLDLPPLRSHSHIQPMPSFRLDSAMVPSVHLSASHHPQTLSYQQPPVSSPLPTQSNTAPKRSLPNADCTVTPLSKRAFPHQNQMSDVGPSTGTLQIHAATDSVPIPLAAGIALSHISSDVDPRPEAALAVNNQVTAAVSDSCVAGGPATFERAGGPRATERAAANAEWTVVQGGYVDANQVTSASDGRMRRRPTGWDVQAPVQDTSNRQFPMGTTYYQPGAAIWVRSEATGKMDLGGPMRRTSDAHQKQVVRPYTASPCRSSSGNRSVQAVDQEPSPIHMPSPVWSQRTQDSRHGAFSLPQMDCALLDSRGQAANGDEAESSAVAARDTIRLHQNSGQDTTDMSIDRGALAPAREAPRAP